MKSEGKINWMTKQTWKWFKTRIQFYKFILFSNFCLKIRRISTGISSSWRPNWWTTATAIFRRCRTPNVSSIAVQTAFYRRHRPWRRASTFRRRWTVTPNRKFLPSSRRWSTRSTFQPISKTNCGQSPPKITKGIFTQFVVFLFFLRF